MTVRKTYVDVVYLRGVDLDLSFMHSELDTILYMKEHCVRFMPFIISG